MDNLAEKEVDNAQRVVGGPVDGIDRGRRVVPSGAQRVHTTVVFGPVVASPDYDARAAT